MHDFIVHIIIFEHIKYFKILFKSKSPAQLVESLKAEPVPRPTRYPLPTRVLITIARTTTHPPKE